MCVERVPTLKTTEENKGIIKIPYSVVVKWLQLICSVIKSNSINLTYSGIAGKCSSALLGPVGKRVVCFLSFQGEKFSFLALALGQLFLWAISEFSVRRKQCPLVRLQWSSSELPADLYALQHLAFQIYHA